MTFTVEIKGVAHRFRAYTSSVLSRKPNVDDIFERAKSGGKKFKKGEKVSYAGIDVAVEGTVTGTAVSFDSGSESITSVVFYRGPAEAETVVGSVEINAAGPIDIELVEPEDD